jgi:hypothetical protein
VIPKLRYVEIDDFDNPSCTLPSANDIASFTTRIGEQSKAVTSVRKHASRDAAGDACGSPQAVAGPFCLGAISVSSSDSAASATPSSSISVDDSASLSLRRLQTGQGLTFEQWMGVCAQCPECGDYYLRGKFCKEHEKKCLGLLDICSEL